jgi:site-specific recombinase XerD
MDRVRHRRPVGMTRLRGAHTRPTLAATQLDGNGQPHYTVHQLRHTRGTQMVQDGHALHIVQRALGHKDPRSTQLYADVTEDDVRRALETRR